MDEWNTYTRRGFIKVTAFGSAALALSTAGVSLLEGCTSAHGPDTLFFTGRELPLLGAIANQIIPPDNFPGGAEAGVVTFLDRQLAGPYHRFQQDYRTGLNALQSTCTTRHNAVFEKLPWDTQTEVLRQMEAGRLSGDGWTKGFDAYFFELLRSHCLQGYYGSPRHGGNNDFISYKMIGLDQPMIVGENRDEM